MACELAIIAYMAGVEQKVSWICDTQKTHGKKRLQTIAGEMSWDIDGVHKRYGVRGLS
jgi:hypothetical protein